MRDVIVISDQTNIPSVAKQVSEDFDWLEDAQARAAELAKKGITSKVYALVSDVSPGEPIVADKAVDVTSEGQRVIGASERNMIVGGIYWSDQAPEEGVVNLSVRPFEDGSQTYLGEVGVRMAINVTMNSYESPKLERVEGVPILHIGTGIKALEAISHLYDRLYR